MVTAANSSDSSLHTRLQELVRETDFDFVVELIDIYLQETPIQIETMKKAVSSQDHHALNISAHTLKGSSLNLGAQQLGAACLKLEELGRSGNLIPADTNTREIEREFEQVKASLLVFKQNKQ
jgi:two-component system, sensor histidine kinase and response regulator